jgi:hemolysin III
MMTMRVNRHPDHSTRNFFRKTTAAQIHLFGLVMMMVGAAYLLPKAYTYGPDHVMTISLFLATGCLVFLGSCTYHFVIDGFIASEPLEKFLENLDHYGIYLFIAGNYTPLFLNTLESPWAMRMTVLVWSIGILGIFSTLFRKFLPAIFHNRFFYTSFFIAMGWSAFIKAGAIFGSLNSTQVWLLFLGGMSYTLGAVVFAIKKPSLSKWFGHHELWHTSVVLGAALHFLLIASFYR